MIFFDSVLRIESKYLYDDSDKKINLVVDPFSSYFDEEKLISNKKKFDRIILVHGCEPPQINNISQQIINFKNYFDKIYSFDEEIIKNCENSEIFLFGSSWVLTDEFKQMCHSKKNYKNFFNTDKKFKVSFIKSNKNNLPGHILRNNILDVISKKREYEFYYPSWLETKIELFTDSSHHITIENSQNKNYFTEKLIDCFMSYTIPIYWGCPNISDYFNPDGIIFFENEDKLDDILNNLSETDYSSRIKAIEENYKIAYEKYAFFYERILELIK